MRQGEVVLLNDGEQFVCRQLAKMRHENNRKADVKNSKIGGQSDEVTDLEGIGAEMAFCLLFNVYPDLSISPRSSMEGQDDGDLILHNGKTVDVKATRYLTGKLIAVPWKVSKVDYFALMVGEFPQYEFKGLMRSDELLKESRLGTLGHGPTFIASQRELKDLEELEQNA